MTPMRAFKNPIFSLPSPAGFPSPRLKNSYLLYRCLQGTYYVHCARFRRETGQ